MKELIQDKRIVEDILQWDTVNWFEPLKFWESKLSSLKAPLNCLELGCREGGLSLWLASKGHHVVASDLEKTEELAKPLHAKYSFPGTIIYKDIDATAIPFESHFDIVIFKSILGGIGRNNNKANQEKTISQILKCLKPGGCLLFAENSKATLLHRAFRSLFTSWGNSWMYLTIAEMKDLLLDFKSAELHSTGLSGVFGRTEGQRKMLGKMDILFLNSITPASWKYIIYGIAVK